MPECVFEFIPFLFDGGAESLVRNYSIALKNQGIEPIIIVLNDKGNTATKRILCENRIKVISLYRKWSVVARMNHKLFGSFHIEKKLKRLIKTFNPVAIHAHLSTLKDLKRCSSIISINNINLFYTCHSLPERYFGGKNKGQRVVAKRLVNSANLRFIALHNQMKNEIDKLFNVNNTVVMSNGIDLNYYRHIPDSKATIRKELGIPEGSFVIGHIGRFIDVKNHVFLVNVFDLLHTQDPNAFLVLVGKGELRETIETQVNERGLSASVKIFEDRIDVNRILKSMDVFVFPSKYEGLPLSLVEAQAAGLKCVISDSINTEAVLSEKCLSLSLNDPITTWVDVIRDDKVRVETYDKIEKFDINAIVLDLIGLYRGKKS